MHSMKFVIGLIVGLTLLGTAFAQGHKYTLWKLTEEKGALQCGQARGQAALVADIDETGTLTTQWEAFCLEVAK